MFIVCILDSECRLPLLVDRTGLTGVQVRGVEELIRNLDVLVDAGVLSTRLLTLVT